MAITASVLTSGFDNTSQTSYSTASITPGPNTQIIAWVTAAGNPPTTGCSGNGLTWTKIDLALAGTTNRRIICWAAMGSPTLSGAVTFTFGAAQDNCAWSVVQYSGTATDNPTGFFMAIGNFTDGTALSATSLSLSHPALSNPNDATAGAMAFNSFGATTISHGSGYTELTEIDQLAYSFETEFKVPGSTTVDWSWSGAHDAVGIAVAIRAPSDAIGHIPVGF